MRVAVLSDIHGHLPALDAALADVAGAGVDRIVVTGDIAAGPMPVPVLERLLGLGEQPRHRRRADARAGARAPARTR